MVRRSFNIFITTYDTLSRRYPFRVNCGCAFVIAISGDFACQKYISRNHLEDFKFDYFQAIRMGLIRSCTIAPFIHFYYPWLNSLLPGYNMVRVCGRVALDQIIGTPIVVCMVFTVNALIEGTFWAKQPVITKEKFFGAWLRGVCYWPFIHSINFRFTPLHHQPLVAHIASIYWQAVLSFYANEKGDSSRAEFT